MRLWCEGTFEASHCLPDEVGGVKRVHGHSYWMRAYVRTFPGREYPLPELQRKLQDVIALLDHQFLNDIIPVPTMECIAEYAAKVIGNAERVDVWRDSLRCGATWTR